jgi:hypothetical protein
LFAVFSESDGGRTSRRYIPIVAQASTACRRPNHLSHRAAHRRVVRLLAGARERVRRAAWHKARRTRPPLAEIGFAPEMIATSDHAAYFNFRFRHVRT